MAEPNTLDGDARLRALLAWRQRLISSGAVSASVFKEAHLRLVHRSGCSDVDQIRRMLPGVVAEHAEEIAGLLIAKDRFTGQPRQRPEEALFPPDAFAPFTFAEQTTTPGQVRLRSDGRGVLTLSWPAHHAPFVVYRVVSAEEHPSYSPDSAHLVAATVDTVAVDERTASSAVRHYQVWVHAGTSHAEALATQPELHATGVMVAGVCDMAVQEDSGKVIGRWMVFPGVRAVHIERVPVEEATSWGPQYRILAGSDNLAGFVDSGAERGRRYLYRARCEVVVDGVARLSGVAQAEVGVSAPLAPVADLALAMHYTEPPAFDLTWTPPPTGRVAIFRSRGAPRADAEAAELPETALEQAGLHPELRLNYPVGERRDPQSPPQAVMAEVPWPADWSRAYFTPVTLLGGRARVGRTTATVRTAKIRDVELTKYCSKQVLRFAWPEGAAAVAVYVAAKGHDPRAGLTGRSHDITCEDYEKYGGMQFTGQLPVGGCSLHLAPVAFSAGRRVLGEFTSITYDGLLRVSYSMQIIRDSAGRPRTAALSACSEVDVTGSPPFVLVHNPDRIPLSVNDGHPLDVAPLDARGEVAAPPCKEVRFLSLGTSGQGEVWVGDVRGRTGWVRLFANLGDPRRLRRLAVLDPPVSTLRLTGASS